MKKNIVIYKSTADAVRYGLLAQVVEHLTFNQVVPRSSRG